MTDSPTKLETEATAAPRPDRRARRRQETIEEILDIASDVMTQEGVNGLSLAEVARRLGVQPPSLYKYFPSLMAIYDALFLEGQRENLERDAQRRWQGAEPGLDALIAGLEASGRWALDNRAVAELLFWRPVPSFHPSAEAFAPAWRWSSSSGVRSPTPWRPASSARRQRRDADLPRLDAHRRRARARPSPTSPICPGARAASPPCSPTLMRLLPAAFPLRRRDTRLIAQLSLQRVRASVGRRWSCAARSRA